MKRPMGHLTPKTLVLAGAVLAACAVQARDGLSIENAWARESPPGSVNGAVYLMIANTGAVDRLIGVGARIARRAELHTHRYEHGMAMMEKVEAIEVPARGRAALRPHGDHVMLVGLERPLERGEAVALELEFAGAGTIRVRAPVLREAPVAAGNGS